MATEWFVQGRNKLAVLFLLIRLACWPTNFFWVRPVVFLFILRANFFRSNMKSIRRSAQQFMFVKNDFRQNRPLWSSEQMCFQTETDERITKLNKIEWQHNGSIKFVTMLLRYF